MSSNGDEAKIDRQIEKFKDPALAEKYRSIVKALAALFGVKQKEQIKTLTTEWEELEVIAVEKNIPTDPGTAFSSQRVRSNSARAAREKAVTDFAANLAGFAKRMEAAEKDGTGNYPEMQKELVGYIDQLTGMSPGELKALANSPFIKDDFKAATAWLEGPDLSKDDKESFIKGLHYNEVRQNAQEWLTWVGTQDVKDDASKLATRQILQGWTRDNFVAAGEWLQGQDAGPAKDTAIQTYAETLAPQEPAAAADWAITLPKGPERRKLLQEIAASFEKKDPAAAAAFAEKHGICSGN